MKRSLEGRVAVVTGGGGGIGTAAALELAREGAMVVAMDPGVGVHGEPLGEPTAAATVKSIEAAGGRAAASEVSVTDSDAVRDVFRSIAAHYGSLDVVINTAGILRPGHVGDASEDDWRAVLDVHFNGYLNVLRAALPIMTEAGSGRIVGVTSGAGLARKSADAPAYGCAKRAVAALTWQLSPLLPAGVAVNALSPIAATRMVRGALAAADPGRDPRSLDLTAMPQPEAMGPAAAYLAGPRASRFRGRVLFSAGPELSLVRAPQLLEAVRAEHVADFATALGTVVPVVFAPAEEQQRTGGGSNPRFGDVFTVAPTATLPAGPERGARARCLVVSDDSALGAAVADAIPVWGLRPVGIGAWQTNDASVRHPPASFEAAEQALASAVAAGGPVDAVVIILGTSTDASHTRSDWSSLLDLHATATDRIVTHAAWLHAAAGYSAGSGRPLRVVHLAAACSPGGRTVAQAVAQMARSATDTAPPARLRVFCVSVETTQHSDFQPIGQLAARLLSADDTPGLAGAELVAGRGWIGLRSHPEPSTTVSFGDPTIPSWVDDLLPDETTTATG